MSTTYVKQLSLVMMTALLGVSLLQAYEQKTYLAPRPVGVNKSIAFTPCAERKDKPALFTGVRFTPFFQASTNESALGRYFGVGNGKNNFTVGKRYQFQPINDPTVPNPLTADLVSSPADVDGALLSGFQDFNNDDEVVIPHQFKGTVTFNPNQEVLGSRFDAVYASHLHEGFFFHVGMPFITVNHHMHMVVTDENRVQIGVDANYNGKGAYYNLQDLFAGEITIPASIDPTDRREPLTKSKITGRKTQGGVADIDVTFGHRKVSSDTLHYSGNVRLTLPTGNRPSGEFLFEPVVGNGHHVGLGFGWDLAKQWWHNQNCNMWFNVGLQYQYLFKDHEARMLGVKGYSTIPTLPQYCLMGTVHGATQDGVAIFPAANQLTRSVNVTPGSSLDALVDVAFHCNSFVFDVGYNLYWKAREKVAVRAWEDNTYGLLAFTFVTDGAVTTGLNGNSYYFVDGKYLNRENLDTAAAETPDQVTHKMHVGVTYHAECCSHPVTAGFGGSFEFAQSNAALDQYAVWVKGGIAW